MSILDFSQNNWEVIYDITLEAVSITTTRFTPIPDHQIPLTLDTHVLLVGSSSFKVRPTWKLGFYLNMVVNAPGVGNFTAANQPIPLGLSLVRFPPISSEFFLKVNIPKWHQEMSIRVWKYIGGSLDVFDYFHEINTDLIRIENKIDNLSF